MVGRAERVLTAAGAGLGLLIVGGGALAALRSMTVASQGGWMDDPWRFVIVGFGALPYLLALAGSFGGATRWAARSALLAAATLLSLAVATVTGFSIGFLFLPSTALLGTATIAALASRPREGEGAPLAAALAVGVVLTWILGVLALFTGAATERCWETVAYADGRVERSVVEHPSNEPMSLGPAGSGVVSRGMSCSSSVITAAAALRSSTLLLGAGALGWLALAFPRARNASPWV